MNLLEKPLLTGGNVRRGQGCCCCDSKRATIIINGIDIILRIILLIILTVAKDEDLSMVLSEEDQDRVTKYYIISMVVTGVGIGFNILSITGASLYNRRIVILGIVWQIINVIMSIVYGAGFAKVSDKDHPYFLMFAGPIIWSVIKIIPQIIFVREINQGIMSVLTYDREERSICCV